MRNRAILVIAVCLLLVLIVAAPAAAQANGVSVTCTDGRSFDNGIEVTVVQMRSGFTYTATAIGLNGFDPVLAVLDSSGNGLCTDDNRDVAGYTVSLPTLAERYFAGRKDGLRPSTGEDFLVSTT